MEEGNTVTLWAIQLDQAFPPPRSPSSKDVRPPPPALHTLLDLVDADSRERINRFRVPEDAQRCLLGRVLPRYVLSSQYGVPWSRVRIASTSLGRPYYANHQDEENHDVVVPRGFDFNVSHDANWIVMASSPTSTVGVDVMRVRLPWKGETVDDFIQALRDQLTEHELRWLVSSSSSNNVDSKTKLERVFQLWTLKEAYVKATGQGLSFDLQRLEFRRTQGEEGDNDAIEAFVDGSPVVDFIFTLTRIDSEHLVAIAQKRRARDKIELKLRHVTLDDIIAVAHKS